MMLVAVYRTILQKANARWPLLSEVARGRYEKMDVAYSAERTAANVEAEDEIVSALEIAHQRFQGLANSGCSQPLEMSAASLSEENHSQMADLLRYDAED